MEQERKERNEKLALEGWPHSNYLDEGEQVRVPVPNEVG